MPVRPLLVLPPPLPIARPKGRGFGARLHKPSRERQQERLGPQYRRLRGILDRDDAALVLQRDPASLAPERAIVLEIAGSLTDFYKAVQRIPGLAFLADEDIGFAADDDFAELDAETGEPRMDRAVGGRRYLAMPTLGALRELLGLYERWDRGEAMPRGFTPWRDLFDQLKTLRAWGPEDRIGDDAIAAWEQDLAAAGVAEISIEAELWFQSSQPARTAAIEAVRADAEALGGRLVRDSVIEPIGYHGALLRLPAAGLRQVMARDAVQLVLADQVMFLRPQAIIRTSGIEALPPDGRDVPPAAQRVAGTPIAALLDGFPIQQHRLLANRLTVDDADDLEARAVVARRAHGTAMASLILHGDLNRLEASLSRPLLVRPIMVTSEGGEETTDPTRLLIDTIYKAVVRMKDPGAPGGASAPDVFLINLSMGDRRRPFSGMMSPWGRLLDYLAARYNVLFLVSAGNIIDDVVLAEFDGIAAFERATDDERRLAFLRHLRDQQSQRTVLAPAEALNPLTVGALHDDDVRPGHPYRTYDPFPGGGVAIISSGLGLGHRRVVKPDVLLPGGRQRLGFKSSPPLTLSPPPMNQGFGLRAAAPDTAGRGALDRRALSCGTSAATALATRAGHQIFDVLMDADGGSNHADIDPAFRAVFIKTLLVHGARWPDGAAQVAEVFGPADGNRFAERVDNVSRLLGYGVPDLARVLECGPSQATLAGCGIIEGDAGHAYRIPLPACLAGVVEPRRLIVTLAWMSPITTTHQDYRRAQLQLAAPEARQQIGVKRAAQSQPSDHASKRGSVLHEIYEGADAVVFVNDGYLDLKVWCVARPLSRPLDAPVRYGLAITIEAGEGLPVYEQVDNRLRAGVRPEG